MKTLDPPPSSFYNNDEHMCLCVSPTILEGIKKKKQNKTNIASLAVYAMRQASRLAVGSEPMLPLNSLLRVEVSPNLNNF